MKNILFLAFVLSSMLSNAQSAGDEKHFIAMFVKDLDATLAWYQDKLGFTIIDSKAVPNTQIKAAIISWKGTLIEMIQHPKATTRQQVKTVNPESVGVQGFFKLGFYVEDLEALQEELKQKGVTIKYPLLTADGFSRKLKLFIVEDNEGNMVQFYNYPN